MSPEGEETRHHIGGTEKAKSRLKGETERSTTNEGEEGSGGGVKAPIAVLGRSSKDKLVASATLR